MRSDCPPWKLWQPGRSRTCWRHQLQHQGQLGDLVLIGEDNVKALGLEEVDQAGLAVAHKLRAGRQVSIMVWEGHVFRLK